MQSLSVLWEGELESSHFYWMYMIIGCTLQVTPRALVQHSSLPPPGTRPVGQVRWTVPPGVSTRGAQNNAIIILRNLTTEDSGDITCSADGIENATATLTVVGEPILGRQGIFPLGLVCMGSG